MNIVRPGTPHRITTWSNMLHQMTRYDIFQGMEWTWYHHLEAGLRADGVSFLKDQASRIKRRHIHRHKPL